MFHAGTSRNSAGEVVSAGGRVLNVTALGKDVAEAQARAYEVGRGRKASWGPRAWKGWGCFGAKGLGGLGMIRRGQARGGREGQQGGLDGAGAAAHGGGGAFPCSVISRQAPALGH